MITLALAGASGRMGSRLIALSKQSTELDLVAALVGGSSTRLGQDAGEVAGIGQVGLPLTAELTATPQLMIDFSTPEATRRWLNICRQRKIALLIGTTGLTDDDHSMIDAAAADIAVLQAANTSLGVSVLFHLAAEAARLLGPSHDIEIVETHHRFKKDAPSGTAKALAHAVTNAIRGSHGEVSKADKKDASTDAKAITTHSLRLGDETGRHTVYFGSLGERVEITHTATHRDVFARGALQAGLWLARQRPGRYTMDQFVSASAASERT